MDEDAAWKGESEADEDTEAEGEQATNEADGNKAQASTVNVPIWRAMKRLRENGFVLVPRLVRGITKNGDQAIVLSQILYWFDSDKSGRPRAQIWRRGRRWFFKSHAEFAQETGIKPRQVRACLQALQRKGFIEIGYFLANGQRTSHISLNQNAVLTALSQAYQEKTR
jgi:biotin operon repressor